MQKHVRRDLNMGKKVDRMKLTKLLILALMLIAAAVFAMQVARWEGTMIFVALYWATLTIKNYVDWKGKR